MEIRNSILDDCKVFVVHAPSGYEYQGNRVIRLFEKHKINFEFVHETNGDHLEELIDKYCDRDAMKKYQKGGIACTVSHILALEKLLETEKKYALIFEDDPCFLGDFRVKLARFTTEIKNLDKGFLISLENTNLKFPSFFQIVKQKHLYQAKMGRMACAYLIDRQGAKNALQDLKSNKCTLVVDWWHNTLVANKVIKLYWLHPALVEQGSLNGKMSSTISSKPNNVKRRIAWLLQKTYKMSIRRLFKQDLIINDK
nr:glycosyltransferase family 25 protein [uncultured Carboxylicivirga sp.]